ncbi:MAG TPA: LacI family transcriptional regulator, partial [Kiloniellaceae bacterium]|nr:LacI family transcriptional regulator [Kiloniellaceae bacterium]
TPFARKQLVRGAIDAVVNQDPGHEARSAARVLLSACEGTPIVADQERIRIDVFLRDNIP